MPGLVSLTILWSEYLRMGNLHIHTAMSCVVAMLSEIWSLTGIKTVKELLGKQFFVADATYSVVDVRNVDGETFVYAEISAGEAGEAPLTVAVGSVSGKGPGRAAFRYADIEHQLNNPVAAGSGV